MVEPRRGLLCAVAGLTVLVLAVPAGELDAETSGGSIVGHIEVGIVHWQRDLDAALEASQRTGKPVFAFFQEVPGCSGCKEFGSTVMSHEPIVQAIEHEFLPVLIYNNRGGKDAEILARFNEPAWNYQVIRFLDGSGRDLIPRKDRVWTRDALAVRMIEALEAARRPVPGYLEVIAYENPDELQEEVAFAQSCFWTGEARLGRIHGVIATEAGWIDAREVTLVRYRPDLVSLDALVEAAVEAGVADRVFVATDEQRQRLGGNLRSLIDALPETYRRASESDQKRQIRGSPFDGIELTDMQRTKVNALARSDAHRALTWLTPDQRSQFEKLQANR